MYDFEAPGKNLFPTEEIHHGIKNFLHEAYERISNANIPVQEVLRKYQGSIEERLMLKHRLILGRPTNKLKITSGSLLWVVRHFIGLLPSPPLPEKDNQVNYLWTEITTLSKTAVASYVTIGRYNTQLVELIAKKLSKLPLQPFILIFDLFDTMRTLAVLPEGEPRINKASAFALAEYFSSSLFIRPFYPGSTDKIEKQYYPITLFMILKWPEIKKYCFKFRKYNYYIYDNQRMPRSLSTKRQFSRRSTVDPNLSDVEIRFDPPIDTTCDYLQDVACQTDDVGSKFQENCFKKCCGVLRTQEEKQKYETKIIYIKQKCCCTYGTNFESVLAPESFYDLEEEQISNDLSDSFLECKKNQSTVSFADVDNEIVSEIPYAKIDHFDPIEKEVVYNKIKKKVRKVGWTYISNFSNEDFDDPALKHDSMEAVSKFGWNFKSKNGDSLENLRNSLNVELKEKFTQKVEDRIETEDFDVQTCPSKLSLPKAWGSISKESRISVNKIKQKLNILNAFSVKNNSKKNLNCKRTESKIKYKRIGSELSLDKY